MTLMTNPPLSDDIVTETPCSSPRLWLKEVEIVGSLKLTLTLDKCGPHGFGCFVEDFERPTRQGYYFSLSLFPFFLV